jgi:hypothetical protein
MSRITVTFALPDFQYTYGGGCRVRRGPCCAEMRISDRSLAIVSLVAGVILGLGGILSGYYFYIQSIQERIPTFLISPVRASIVKSDSNDLTDLSILYKGKPVQKNVVAVRIYMWNGGNLPIMKSDILRPIRIVFPEDAKILDYKILKHSRDVSNIEITSTNYSNVNLYFDILEHNDGVAIQVIYAPLRCLRWVG